MARHLVSVASMVLPGPPASSLAVGALIVSASADLFLPGIQLLFSCLESLLTRLGFSG